MRKILSILCAITILTLSACSNNTAGNTAENTDANESHSNQTAASVSENISITNADDFKETVESDVEKVISELEKDFEALSAEVDTYRKFLENTDKAEAFYSKALSATNELCLRLRVYALNYAELVMSADSDLKDKYKDLEKIYRVVYDSARDDIYSDIYDGVVKDMYNRYYDGIFSDAYENKEYTDYNEWSSAHSKEYKRWSNTRSDIYSAISDAGSDVYSFYSSIRSSVYNKDAEKAQKDIEDFSKDIDSLSKKPSGTESSDAVISDVNTDTSSVDTGSANTLEELENAIEKDTDNTIKSLCSDFEALKSETNTYSKYCGNTDKVKSFYEKTVNTTKALCIRMREYSLKYAELILAADTNSDKKYNDVEKIYRKIYNGALEDVYSDIYNGLLEDMYNYYYNGILEDAYDKGEEPEYSKWFDVSSKEYKMYSDTSSAVYKAYSDASSDIYSFYSDLSSDFFNDKKDDAKEDIDGFKKDIEKLR